MKSKKGISLIVLIVTIIVIIILAAAVILTLNNNNPVDSSRIAQLADNRASINSAINLYYGKKMAETQGIYDANQIFTGKIDYTKDDSAENKIAGITSLGATNAPTGFAIKYGTYMLLDDSSTGAVKTATDVKLPEIANAKWYIDVNSGLVYLVYSSVDNIPAWMKVTEGSTTKMDTTLLEIVKVPKSDSTTLEDVTFSSGT